MSTEQRFCSECGAPLEENDHFCPVCGAKVVDMSSHSKKKSPTKKAPNSPPPENKKRSTDDTQSEKSKLPSPAPTIDTKQNNNNTSGEDNSSGNIGLLVTLGLILAVVIGGLYGAYIKQENQRAQKEALQKSATKRTQNINRPATDSEPIALLGETFDPKSSDKSRQFINKAVQILGNMDRNKNIYSKEKADRLWSQAKVYAKKGVSTGELGALSLSLMMKNDSYYKNGNLSTIIDVMYEIKKDNDAEVKPY